MLKCLVSDLDGTLLKIGNELSAGVSEENKQALRAFCQRGGHLALASSRGADYQKEIAEILGFPVCFIGQNGFEVCDEAGTLLDRRWMDLDDLRDLVGFLQKTGLNGSLICTDDQGRHLGWGKEQSYPQIIPDRCPILRTGWKLSFEPIEDKRGKCGKISLFVDPAEHAKASVLLHQEFGHRFEIAASDLDMQDISPLGINKGSGIVALARGLNLDLEEMAVVGDNENDLSMFSTIRNSYCMDHAPHAVASHASRIVRTVAEALQLAESDCR